MSCLCLGPKCAGKSHLLKALQETNAIDGTTYPVPTVGTSIFNIRFPSPKVVVTSGGDAQDDKSTHDVEKPIKCIRILEIVGSMAPLWRRYFNDNVKKIIYVVDTTKSSEISAAGVLLYSILTEPHLQNTKFLLVLSKMDDECRKMRNEALLMLEMPKLEKETCQEMTVVETSALTGDGFDKIYEWLQTS